jgi:beta-glucosidase
MKFRTLLILIIVTLTFSCKSNAKEKVEEVSVIPYPSTDLSPQDRARELLKKMTLEEKVGQMTQVARDYIINPKDISKYHFGSILSGGGSSPSQNTPKAWADMIDNYQIEALNTRLRIPLLYGTDSVHGHNNLKNATIFPHNIGLGATRNDKLVEEIAHITAIESRATGIHWNFAPSVSVPQHISWGRTYEGFSEDPDISGALGAAAVRGYQGKDISDNTRVIATAKHFVGDGGTTGGKDQGDTQVTRDVLVNFHAMPYRQSIQEGVKTVMATFNSWNGVKAHGSKEISK